MIGELHQRKSRYQHPMIKTLILRIAQILGLFALSRHLTRRSLRILCYHGTWQGPAPHYGDCLFMDPARFARRMHALKRRGYRVIPLAEGCRRLAAGTLEARDLVITIDDGWKGTYRDMLPVLSECNFPATLYVATEPIIQGEPLIHLLTVYMVERSTRRPEEYAGLFPELGLSSTQRGQLAQALSRHIFTHPTAAARRIAIDEIGHKLGIDTVELSERAAFHLMTLEEVRAAHECGVDVQLHTHTHKMHGFVPSRVKEEITLNRQHVTQITGRPPSELVHFCYPSGLFHPSVYEVLRQTGIISATTTEFGLNPPGSDPLALKRILDCESLTELDLEARLSGFWTLAQTLRAGLQRLKPNEQSSRPRQPRAHHQ